MKKLINIFLIIYLLIFPAIANAKTIRETVNLPMLDDCFFNYLSFKGYVECFFENFKTTKNIKQKQILVINDLYELLNNLNYAVEDKFISKDSGKEITLDIYNHPFSQKYKKVRLAKATDETGCSLAATFEEFINCFYINFRSLEVYRTSSIQTKIQMERIMYNSLKLLNKNNIIMVVDTLNGEMSIHKGDYNIRTQGNSVAKNFNGPFDFFYQEMDKVGTSLFDKIKENEDEIKRVLTLIVISIVVGMIIQKVIVKSAVGGGGGGGGQLSYSGGQASSGSSGAGSYLFSNAPAGSVLQKRWFRYGIAKGFF